MIGRGYIDEDLHLLCIETVSTLLDVAKTYTLLAHIPEKRRHSLELANRALGRATKFMFKLRIAGKEFDQMTAMVERLKFDLEQLAKNGTGDNTFNRVRQF